MELDNSYTKGVDWSKFELGFSSYLDDKSPSRLSFNKGTVQNPAHSLRNISGGFIIGGNLSLSLDGVLNFLNSNGKTHIISSPKIMAMNNQQALISVGDNINYRIAEDIIIDGEIAIPDGTLITKEVMEQLENYLEEGYGRQEVTITAITIDSFFYIKSTVKLSTVNTKQQQCCQITVSRIF